MQEFFFQQRQRKRRDFENMCIRYECCEVRLQQIIVWFLNLIWRLATHYPMELHLTSPFFSWTFNGGASAGAGAEIKWNVHLCIEFPFKQIEGALKIIDWSLSRIEWIKVLEWCFNGVGWAAKVMLSRF